MPSLIILFSVYDQPERMEQESSTKRRAFIVSISINRKVRSTLSSVAEYSILYWIASEQIIELSNTGA